MDINDERSVRLQRLGELQGAGISAYPSHSMRTHTIAQLIAAFADGGEEVTIVGRLRGVRRHGGSTFLDLEDSTGRFQVFCSKADLAAVYEQLITRLDLGDHVQATGKPFRTKAGSPALHASDVTLLSKALRPLPEQFHGLTDTELRYRRRELDLIANPEARSVARTRSMILRTLRAYLDEAGFLEVETPILQSIASGASAKPFVTHHNTLHEDLYLRVAPELYLKRLIVGGLEKVYEVARCFRNEGMDPQHNPEFTQIEFYAAYWDYQQMLTFCQDVLVHTVEKVHGKLVLEFDGKALDFTPPFAKASYIELLKEHCGVNILEATEQELSAAIAAAGGDADPKAGRGKLIDELWKTAVRPSIQRPTFVTDYPAELSPLAKRSAKDPRVVEMFQLVIAGSELIKAFTELNDPVDQQARFTEQDALRKKGDDEAQYTDEVFVESLEYGMPPTAGAGLGIDRLTSILTGSHSVKEVILFPTLRKN
ncbi:MAG: lysine--tRNA ligase [Patescibacteria group bacterium]